MNKDNAIAIADEMRPNAVSDYLKKMWLQQLEGQISEFMDVSVPEGEVELLLPAPHDNVYPLYLVAMIDNAQEETTLYANDNAVFNAAMTEARAWWRRNNKKRHHDGYKGVWR